MTNFILNTFDNIYNWAKINSLWPIIFADSCCSLEITNSSSSTLLTPAIFQCSPQQSDLLIVAGTVTYKSAPVILNLYEQMAEPKYVIAFGNCACNGGLFKNNSFSVICGLNKIIPVDIFIPICPPKINALSDALIHLKNKIKSETSAQRHNYLLQHHPKLICKNYSDILTEEKY